jgi:hypothetical protein
MSDMFPCSFRYSHFRVSLQWTRQQNWKNMNVPFFQKECSAASRKHKYQVSILPRIRRQENTKEHVGLSWLLL